MPGAGITGSYSPYPNGRGRISLRTELPILGDRKRLTVSDACLSLGRYAMLQLEQQKKQYFRSHLSLWGLVDQNDALSRLR